jgi:hypothetical protein
MFTTFSKTSIHLFQSVSWSILATVCSILCSNSSKQKLSKMNTVLLVNTPCSHLHSFCATGVSSGLATGVALTRAWRGRLGESITRGWTCFWYHFCTVLLTVVELRFKIVHSVLLQHPSLFSIPPQSLLNRLFPSRFPTRIVYEFLTAPMRAVCLGWPPVPSFAGQSRKLTSNPASRILHEMTHKFPFS